MFFKDQGMRPTVRVFMREQQMRIDELILYRGLEQEPVLRDAARLMEAGRQDQLKEKEADKARIRLYRIMHGLVELAEESGFYGSLWHCYLTNLLVNHENSYSRSREIRGAVSSSINVAALHDFEIFRSLFDYDFRPLAHRLGVLEFDSVLSFSAASEKSRIYNRRIRDRICTLAGQLAETSTAQEMMDAVTRFYGEYGVGRFGLHKAFRVHEKDGEVMILPIRNILHVHLDDLIGYEAAKQKLVENTEAFVSGRPANNCLLYGDAGTGKSSSIKAIANQYYDRGLRIIEIYRHQFRNLNEVISQVKGRNYRFIIYMDDLSFEEFETEYKYLKAVIEGGLEKKPENVLIYATSNRRHLVRESFKDRENSFDKHGGDTVQEKLSLAARFGLSIYFGKPEFDEYQEIVAALAERSGIEMEREALRSEATRWQMRHGGLSGRTAQQFIDHLLGQQQS